MTANFLPLLGRGLVIALRQRHEQLLHLRIVGGSQAGGRVPSLNGGESIGVTSGIGTVSDIMEDLRMSIEHGVHEANRALAGGETLFVDLSKSALV